MPRKYDHLMRPCTNCGTMFNYRERGGKYFTTCCTACSKANLKNSRRKASAAYRARKRMCK